MTLLDTATMIAAKKQWRIIIIGLLIASGGCSSSHSTQPVNPAQELLDQSQILCRDGVEYLFNVDGGAEWVVPHLKPDGKPFACRIPKK